MTYAYNVFSDKCISRKLLNVVTRRWSLLILASLRGGPQRFSELEADILGISERMLSITLKTLVSDSLVSRSEQSGSPEYALTEPGMSIAGKVDELFKALYSALDHMDSSGFTALAKNG